jgi:hypothetical protein
MSSIAPKGIKTGSTVGVRLVGKTTVTIPRYAPNSETIVGTAY